MKETRTTTARLVLGDDDILRIYPLENAVITLEAAKNHYFSENKLTEGKKALVLVYGNVNYTITREAKKYAASQSHTRIATAVVSNKLRMILIVRMYAWLMKPKSPVRVFNSEEKAISWLKSFQ